MSDSYVIDPAVLAFMRCPVTQSELTTAPEDLIDLMNGLIESSQQSKPRSLTASVHS